MEKWHELALEYCKNGSLYRDITERINNELGTNVSYNTLRCFLYKRGIRSQNQNTAGKPAARTKNDSNRNKGKTVVVQNLEPNSVDSDWDGAETITFGLIGDTHINSKYAQITHLHTFYDICAGRGIRSIYHTGDISDGLKMRPGHEYEIVTSSVDEMEDMIARVYPERKGITTYYITGNHDASVTKLVGHNIAYSKALSSRKDMVFLGVDCAVVNLTPNCTLELRHPWDGTSYAQSYKPQKMIEAMESDSKPNILAIGHYHKMEQLFYRNIHCFQTACFQSQTNFTRGKGISIATGGWIITCKVDKDGTVKSISGEFIPFYKSIKDDYKNWH